MAFNLPEGNLSEIIKVAHFSDATVNIAPSTTNYAIPISFSYARLNANSNLIITGHVPICGQNSYGCGEFVEINGFRKYETTAYLYAAADGDDGAYGCLKLSGFWSAAQLGATTGNITVGIGWNSRSGSTGERLGVIWNPYQRAARRQSNLTQVTILELLENNFIND